MRFFLSTTFAFFQVALAVPHQKNTFRELNLVVGVVVEHAKLETEKVWKTGFSIESENTVGNFSTCF